jgi:uncharacterized membrane protein
MKTTQIQPHKSSIGMDANIASLVIFIAMAVASWIPYIGWAAWVVPLVFFFMEKVSGFVKFQAVTAFIIGIIQAAISIVLQIFIWITTPRITDVASAIRAAERLAVGKTWGIWSFFGGLATVVNIAISILIVYLIVMAYQYKQVELPVIGPLAETASAKLDSYRK